VTSAATRSELAPAKINLALHVTGRRSDGYHTLDSLVVFADIADRIELDIGGAPAGAAQLAIEGPFAAGLSAGADNLILKACRALEAEAGGLPPLAIRLFKHLPLASGIGGGSADAAAMLRLLAPIVPVGEARLAAIAARLGADVPMCLRSAALRAGGAGEALSDWPDAPALPLLLVNPGVAVSTPAVFARLERRDHPSIGALPATPDAGTLAGWLERETRNDLQAAAIGEAPVIAAVLESVRAMPGCLLARMSGSGATVFGIFANEAELGAAAGRLARERPDWWVAATRTRAGALAGGPDS